MTFAHHHWHEEVVNRIPGLRKRGSAARPVRLALARPLWNVWPGWSQLSGSGSVATDKPSQSSRLFDWRYCAYKNNLCCARGMILWSYFRVCLGKAPERSSIWLWTVTNAHAQDLRAWGVCGGPRRPRVRWSPELCPQPAEEAGAWA